MQDAAADIDTLIRPEPNPIEVGPLTQYLGYYLRRLYEAYRRHFLKVAGEFDFGPREVGAVFVIGLNPGLTPSQLREALAMDGAQITALLNTFERRGYIERRVSPTDGRSRHVFLTVDGGALLARLKEVVGWFDESFSQGVLSEEEMAELLRLLTKLHAATSTLNAAD
nr:MarR family winged helix-turn-helix transcriptional regulator [Novosphingobium sp. SG751A]